MVTRGKHPQQHVEEAQRHAERNGWRVVIGGGHAWGQLRCPNHNHDRPCGEFCVASVWSAPTNPVLYARALRRVVEHCTAHRTDGAAPDDTE